MSDPNPIKTLRAYVSLEQVPKAVLRAVELLEAQQAGPARVASVSPLPFVQPTSAEIEIAHARREIDRLAGVCAERDRTLAELIGKRDRAFALLDDELPSTKDARDALRAARICAGLAPEPASSLPEDA